jgi:homogentisate 1,2-dioxygenase
MRFLMSRRTAPTPFTLRRIDADEIHFIHRGRGRLLTETGAIEAPAGRVILIARGIG